jgi:hypothetical protein
MIRTPPAQISAVVLVVEPDEAFNPGDVGVLGPDAFVTRILIRTGSKVDGNRGGSSQCVGGSF